MTQKINITQEIFDDFGRCVPTQSNAQVHRTTRRRFIFSQPVIRYSEIYERTIVQFGDKKEINLSAEDFETRAQSIRNSLEADPIYSKLFRNAAVPFLLPKNVIHDYGTALEKTYLPAVSRSFQSSFPEYSFTNHNPLQLANRISIETQSKHQHLIEVLSKDNVVGWLFPCFSEYSIPAAIERIKDLPPEMSLAGGIEICAALIGSPDLLMRRDGYSPLLWLAAIKEENNCIGYHFEAYGHNLTFNRRPHLGNAAEYWCSAIVVLG